MDVRLQHGLLYVRTEGRIPKVCVLCGATKDVVPRTEHYAMGLSPAEGEAAARRAMKISNPHGPRRSPGTHLASTVASSVMGAALADRMGDAVAVELPVCRSCDARWAEAEQRRGRLWPAFVLVLGCVGVGIAVGALWLAGLGLALGIAWIVFGILGQPSAPTVTAGFVGPEEIGLQIEKEIAEKIVERARRREERAQRTDDAKNTRNDADEAPASADAAPPDA